MSQHNYKFQMKYVYMLNTNMTTVQNCEAVWNNHNWQQYYNKLCGETGSLNDASSNKFL